jgi:serine/threonine protein kinase
MASPNSNPEPFLSLLESKAELCGRFTNIKRLGPMGGGGHFSLLFEAQDQTTDQRVALKFLDPTVIDPYRIESFTREVDVLAKLENQPDILQRYSSIQEIVEPFQHASGMVLPVTLKFYAMELASCDLGTVLDTYDVDPIDKRLQFRTMCRAVQRIHRRGIVHRDVKPSNFLVMKDDTLRLSDFGTARCLEDSNAPLKRYSGPPGDWTYAPLEMVGALHDLVPDIAYAGDIYALGAVLFEMFTGTPLNLHLFTRIMLTDLNMVIGSILPGDKINEFHKVIGSISNRFALPNIRDFGNMAPRAIVPILNRMYGSLAALDYRQRAKDCTSTFLQINQCLLVLKNEAAYARWIERKKAYRRSQEQKRSMPRTILTTGANL